MGIGREAVSLARSSVESEVLGGDVLSSPSDPAFKERSGAFVTISEYPSHDLRGCIGYPMPVLPLGEAIEQSARSACHDPRFPDLRAEELPHVSIEVTVLSVPRYLHYSSPEELESQIRIGRDGLIIELMGRRGLLLPQVPTEWGWDVPEYLANLSLKAGLPPTAWRDPRARVQSFTGEIYSETSPGVPPEDRDGRYREGRRGQDAHRR